jgi:hypothetical protein
MSSRVVDPYNQINHSFISSLFRALKGLLNMSAFMRSVSPFLQTAKATLRQGNAVSPLHFALQRQQGAPVLNAFRSYATAFTRDKPHVNIGIQPPLKYSIVLLLMK